MGVQEGIMGSEWEDKAAERLGRPAIGFMDGSIRLKVIRGRKPKGLSK